MRNDIDVFSGIPLEYLVLDEGHVIKNTKSKTAMAIRRLDSRHRLILSGTPIQARITFLQGFGSVVAKFCSLKSQKRLLVLG